MPLLEPRREATRAMIRAARGDRTVAGEVEHFLAMVADTSYLNLKTDLLVEAAEAMASLGDRPAAIGYARDALGLAEAKQNIARAGQTRLLLGRIEG
jgi:hypothetical protein